MDAIAARWLESPPRGWDALLAEDPNAAPAHRPELARAFASTLPGMTPAWIAVEEDDTLIGGAPVMVERRGGFHWLHAMPFLLGGAPLARPGAHARVDRAVAATLEACARDLAAVGSQWVLYRPQGPEPAAAALALVSGETRVAESAILDLESGLEAAWGRADRDARHAIGQARRRGLRAAEEPEALEEAYALYAGQARAWRAHRPRPLELWRRLLDADAGEPAARLFTVRDGRGLLAVVLTLIHPREALAWLSGTHPAGRPGHAFPLLLWSVAEWAKDAGCTRLNLGASAGRRDLMSFKDDLGARVHRYPVRWIGAAHAGWLGRRVAALQAWQRRRRRGGDPA